MRTYVEIAAVLRARLQALGMSHAALVQRSGLAKRTLQHVLGGDSDYKVGTLLALLDRLGLELVIVPKAAAGAVQAGDITEPKVRSVVEDALDRLKDRP